MGNDLVLEERIDNKKNRQIVLSLYFVLMKKTS